MDKLHNHKSMLLIGFALVVLMQWAHFSIYYQQPIGLSLLWSVVDWSVWFLLGIGVISYFKFRYRWYWGLIFILIAGPAQILISSAIYHVIYEADKTLIESFFHLMNKRWLQNIFIGSIILLLVSNLRQRFGDVSVEQQKVPNCQNQTLVLDDGKNTYQLSSNDVLAVVAAKNYLSIYTCEKEIVIRETLKNMQSRLASDHFIQVSRSALVKRSAVVQIERYSKTSFRAVLFNQHAVNIGRTFVDEVKQDLRLSLQSDHSSL